MRLVLPVLSILVALPAGGLALTLGAGPAPGGGPGCQAAKAAAEAPPRSASVDDPYQEVFFATLEGLYRDGVPTEVVDGMLVLNDQGQHALFVGGCQICLPVLNALNVYRGRPDVLGFKVSFDTFGAGLSEADVAAATGEDIPARYAVLERLVTKWVAERLEMRRLTGEERAQFQLDMEIRRKKGMAGLAPQKVNGKSASFKACASCDAANVALDRWR